MDEGLQQALAARLHQGQLRCADAHALANEQGVAPLDVGRAADEAGIRISHCLLGLFGYGPKAEGKHKIVQPLDPVPNELAARLLEVAADGRITCADVWAVAEGAGVGRMKASGAVEALGLKVSICQLGCFPRPKAS
jgi:hypothetical protein